MDYKYSYLLGKSSKIDKSDKGTKYENFIMYLAPHTLSGTNICPNASLGCAAACLNLAGRGKFDNVQKARLNRTLHYLNNRKEFLTRLEAEVLYHSTISNRVAFRLNGTSDINFVPFIRKMHRRVHHAVFYDYTKNPLIALRAKKLHYYNVTFSRSEENIQDCLDMLKQGVNVAVVFIEDLPISWAGYKVIDGDKTDARFLDPQGVVVGLKLKGSKKEKQAAIESGFAI